MKRRSLFTLSVMQTMTGRAIRDMRNGGSREMRNVLELCRGFARSPRQREVWDALKVILTAPGNRYQGLLHRVACSVREDSLKTLIINLSCNAFSAGRELLRMQAASGTKSLWLQQLSPVSDLRTEVRRCTQLGTCVFLIDLQECRDCRAQAAELAARNSRCIFIYLVSDPEAEFPAVIQAVQCENVCILLAPDAVDACAPALKKRGILFGIIRNYDDIQDLSQEKDLLEHWTRAGCLLCVYRSPQHSQPCAQNEELYSAMNRARRSGQPELFLCDLDRDTAAIQDILLERRDITDFIRPDS